jgi:hypothetical protein
MLSDPFSDLIDAILMQDQPGRITVPKGCLDQMPMV